MKFWGSSLPLIMNWCHPSLHYAQLGLYLHPMRNYWHSWLQLGGLAFMGLSCILCANLGPSCILCARTSLNIVVYMFLIVSD
jgi:hypothetical protein